MKITYEIEDGYVGKSRPHTITIPDSELESLDYDEKVKAIDDAIDEHFKQNIFPVWDRRQLP